MTEILRYIGIGIEGTFGTEATPAIHVDPGSISLDTPNNAEISVVGGMGRMVARKRAGYYCPQGNFEYATDLNTIGYLFRGILDGYVFTTGGGGGTPNRNLHEFYGGNSPDLKSFTIEAGKDVFEHVFMGCCFNTLGLSVDSGLVMANLGIVAQKDKSDTLKAVSALTLTEDYPLAFYEVSASVNSSDVSAKITSCNLNFNNNISTDRGRHLGSRYPTCFKANARDITATIQMEFEAETYLDLFWGSDGAPDATGADLFPLLLTFNAGATVGDMTISMPNCYLESITTQPSGRDSLIQTLNVRAMLDEDVMLADAVTAVDTDILVTLDCDTLELKAAT